MLSHRPVTGISCIARPVYFREGPMIVGRHAVHCSAKLAKSDVMAVGEEIVGIHCPPGEVLGICGVVLVEVAKVIHKIFGGRKVVDVNKRVWRCDCLIVRLDCPHHHRNHSSGQCINLELLGDVILAVACILKGHIELVLLYETEILGTLPRWGLWGAGEACSEPLKLQTFIDQLLSIGQPIFCIRSHIAVADQPCSRLAFPLKQFAQVTLNPREAVFYQVDDADIATPDPCRVVKCRVPPTDCKKTVCHSVNLGYNHTDLIQ